MRVLLTSNASYLPPRGGSTRGNLAYLRALLAKGHRCRVVAAAPEAATTDQQVKLRGELEEQQLDPSLASLFARQSSVTANLDGIEVLAVRDLTRHAPLLAEQIGQWHPDWVLVSSEDLSHSLLRQCAKSAPGRIVFLAHTPQWFPFGPAAWNSDREAAEAVKSAAAIVVISQAMAVYVHTHLGRRPEVVHPPLYEPGAGMLGQIDGAIGMVNPCAVKGIDTFIALADRLPSRRFAALPGWGTTAHDLSQLKLRQNIVLLPRVRKIEDFLRPLAMLLMPSVWLEGFGLIVMEAMLRGVPVIATDSGGLAEAKSSTGFVISTRLIEKYEAHYDDRNMPRPVLPPVSIEPWVIAIQELTESRESYELEQRRERDNATRFVRQIDPNGLETILAALPSPPELPSGKAKPNLSQLSEPKRDLLLRRLREQAGERKA